MLQIKIPKNTTLILFFSSVLAILLVYQYGVYPTLVTNKTIAVENKKLADNKVIADAKVISDKKIADEKAVADAKIIADAKVIADKKVADAKIIADAKVIADKKLADKLIADKTIEYQRLKDQQISNPSGVTTIVYTMDAGYFSECNYPNGSTLQFKVGQTLKLKGTLLNGTTERIMEMGGGSDKILGGNSSYVFKMLKVGGVDLTIIPNKYEWDRAYTFHIVVSN